MATTSSMFMYSLTIQPATAITQAILGQFAGTKEQQIVTASGSKLTLHRPEPSQGRITPIYSQDVFGIIRTLAAFRLAGSNKGMKLSPLPKDAAFSDLPRAKKQTHPRQQSGITSYGAC
jgi:hypothetical protein